MKTEAAVLYSMGHASPFQATLPLKVEILELAAPGPGEVLVEIAAAGLCHSDLSVINGSRPRVMPMVMGHEASGTVREVGAGVANLKVHDHVVFSFVPHCGLCAPCAEGRAVLCEPAAKANAFHSSRKFGRRRENHHGILYGIGRTIEKYI